MDNISVIFTQQQLQVIEAGLLELPMKISGPVVMEINRQIAETLKAKNEQLPDPS